MIEAVGRRKVTTPAEFDAALAEQDGPLVLRVRREVDGEVVTRLVVWER